MSGQRTASRRPGPGRTGGSANAASEDATAREIEDLRELVSQQVERLHQLSTHVTEILAQQRELHSLMWRGQRELLRRVEQLQRQRVPEAPPVARTDGSNLVQAKAAEYARIVVQLKALVRRVVPPDATIIVVSRGDEELLDLDGRRGWHFPQAEDGVYAGHHPRDSAAATAQLEELRGRGAQWLLLPHTALWWLEHYPEFRLHLETNYQLAASQQGIGILFALSSTAVR